MVGYVDDPNPNGNDSPRESFGKRAAKEGGRAAAIATAVIAALAAYSEFTGEPSEVPQSQPPVHHSTSADSGSNSDLAEPIRELTKAIDSTAQAIRGNNSIGKLDGSRLIRGQPQQQPQSQPVVQPAFNSPLTDELKDTVSSLEMSLDDCRLRYSALAAENESLKAKLHPPYTGIVIWMNCDPLLAMQGKSNCVPCNNVTRAILTYGRNWTIGPSRKYHFWTRKMPTPEPGPRFEVWVDGKVDAEATAKIPLGYRNAADMHRLFAVHPNLENKHKAKQTTNNSNVY